MNKEKLDTFLTQENCDRCGDKLVVRTMSWFTDETICEKCSDQEIQFKTNINKIGLYHGDYEWYLQLHLNKDDRRGC
jgi:predicted nucleic acid-binding Zn ribbon protein